MLELWNKVDALDPQTRVAVEGEAARRDDVIPVSALSGEGVEQLREAIGARLHEGAELHKACVPAGDGERIAWLHARGEVVGQQVHDDLVEIEVRLSSADWEKFQAL